MSPARRSLTMKKIKQFFSWFFHFKVHNFFAQIVRVIFFVPIMIYNRHPEKVKENSLTRLLSWAFRNEPEDPDERYYLSWHRRYSAFTFFLFATFFLLLLLIFGSPVDRALSSFRYMGDAARYIFLFLFMGEEAIEGMDIPQVANASAPDFEKILEGIQSFWFYFQAYAGCLFNFHISQEWFLDFTTTSLNIFRFITWIPVFILVAVLIKTSITNPKEGEQGDKTKALQWWDDVFIPKVGRPAKDIIRGYASFWRENLGKIKLLFFLSTAILCIYGWTIIDFFTSYFMMMSTLTFGWFPSFFTSAFIDAVNFFVRLGIPGWIGFTAYGFYKVNVKGATAELSAMQSANEQTAESSAVILAINGPVGVGKTQMATSMATDGDSEFRNQYLSTMMKYTAAFPKFDWPKFEAWIAQRAAPHEGMVSKQINLEKKTIVDEDGNERTITVPVEKELSKPHEDSSVTPNGEHYERINTRAKLQRTIEELWKRWVKAGYPFETEDNREAFFGYDPEDGLTFFDGAKNVPLLDAVIAYGQSYLMYFTGKKLVTSNYPIAMEDGRYGLYFPMYTPAGAYLARPSSRLFMGGKSYSTILNQDYFRIKVPLNPDDPTKDGAFDGGVIVMTESSNERGNRNDYANMSRKDKTSNKVNDGFNQFVRLFRHPNMVDKKTMCRLYFDYQRGQALNADLRETAEDTIFIMERSPEQNTLPLWWLIDYVCEAVKAHWNSYYWYSFRPNRNKQTLYNRFLSWICNKFINLHQRLRYGFGYEVGTFVREHGGGNGMVGQKDAEQYYYIYRKVRSDFYDSGVYAPILEQRSVYSPNGWIDQPTYDGIKAKPSEFAKQNSFFIDEISTLFDADKMKEAMANIKNSASLGTNLWSYPSEEEPSEE